MEIREDLTEQLDRASGGVIFTTMQKFAPPSSRTAAAGSSDYPAISDRRNVIVIADEHASKRADDLNDAALPRSTKAGMKRHDRTSDNVRYR